MAQRDLRPLRPDVGRQRRGGLGLFVGNVLALAAVFDDTHSTAGLGMSFFPAYVVLALGAWLVIEWGTLTLVRRAGHRTR